MTSDRPLTALTLASLLLHYTDECCRAIAP